MKLYLKVIPFRSADLPRWLEQHLVSDHLGELIAELLAIRQPPSTLDFDDWFNPLKQQILSSGLSNVPRAALRQLIAHPPALRHLQKAVLLGGGQHWDRVPRSAGFRHRLTDARTLADTPAPPSNPATRVAPRPTPPADSTPDVVAVTQPPTPFVPQRRGVPGWAMIVGVAAAALFSLIVWLTSASNSPLR